MSETVSKFNGPKIKIYVICHKDSYVPSNEILYPIQVGSDLSEKKIPEVLHDNTGDNISRLNDRYCELTAQYWAWKNDEADYYGFMHYRRYFSFNPAHLKEDQFGNIIMEDISDNNLNTLFYSPQYMKNYIANYDVITVTPTNLELIGETVYGHYQEFSHDHRIEDLDVAMKIILRDYPYLSDAMREYVNSSKAYFCNMYIMKKELFIEYNKWLFDFLRKHEQERCFDEYSKEEYRVSAFLAERLWGIYYTYLKDNRNIRFAELQRTLFTNTDKTVSPLHAFQKNNIPIVLSASNDYVPYVAVVIQSIIEHSEKENNYDIWVLHSDIEKGNISNIENEFKGKDNVSVRFFDVSKWIKNIHFSVNSHFKKENYYRLFIPFVFKCYDKILYLDSDLIVLSDISKLYNVRFSDELICAVKDVDWIAAYNNFDGIRKQYADDILGLKQPYNYFNSGVLVFNIKEFSQTFTFDSVIKIISSQNWMFVDQDVLNVMCENRVKYIDMSWNVLYDYREPNYSRMEVAKCIPYQLYAEYVKCYNNPRIMHYAGCKKPWNSSDCDRKEYFWKYARKTSFYEEILRRFCAQSSDKIIEYQPIHSDIAPMPTMPIDYQGVRINGVDGTIYTDGLMVKFINFINRRYPIGSVKRERIKKIASYFIK